MQRSLLLINIALCLCLTFLSQTTYYIDSTRSNNTGTGTSWATVNNDLQIAINITSVGDQIWVKAGTYLPTHDLFANITPTNNRDKTFSLKNGVKIYGGFAGTETDLNQRNWQTNFTTLSGDLGILNTLKDDAYQVVISVNFGATLLDVFFSKGYAVSPQSSIIVIT